jgi:WD40 repeat protein
MAFQEIHSPDSKGNPHFFQTDDVVDAKHADEPDAATVTGAVDANGTDTLSKSISSDTVSSVESDLDETFRFKRRTTISNKIKDTPSTEVFCLEYSHDSRFLAAGCGDGSIRVFNSVGRMSYLLNVGVINGLPTTCVRYRPVTNAAASQGVLLVGGADGVVSHWHVSSQKCMYSMEEVDNQIFAVQYRPDGEQFVTAGRDCKVRIYEESTKTLLTTMCSGKTKRNTGHSNRIYAVAYKPDDPNILLSAGWDNTVQYWDTRIGQSFRSIYGPHVCGDGLDIHGDSILTASWRPNDALELWDFGTGKKMHTVEWSKSDKNLPEMLYSARFSSDGSLIAAGGSGTNEGRVFDVNRNFRQLDRVSMGAEHGVYAAAFSPNVRRLAFAGGAEEISVLQTS